LIDKLFDSKGASFQQFLQKNTRWKKLLS
jgi:hypothetical protein